MRTVVDLRSVREQDRAPSPELDVEFGSVRGYLEQRCGLAPEELDTLAANLLVRP